MTVMLPIMLSVMLLSDPAEVLDAAAAAAIAEDTMNIAESRPLEASRLQSAKVRSQTSDYDRKAGVVMYEGDVVVEYSNDCVMCADQLYMFLNPSNELTRIVAIGRVSITNDTRVGSCAMATYRHREGMIEMYGEGKEGVATLTETSDASELKGGRVRFWIGSEQVEIDNSQLKLKTEGDAKIL